MATKTISIDLDAYGKLSLARLNERESFSKVIKRARWPRSETTGRALLEVLDQLPRAPKEIIKELEFNQSLDKPPTDRWD